MPVGAASDVTVVTVLAKLQEVQDLFVCVLYSFVNIFISLRGIPRF